MSVLGGVSSLVGGLLSKKGGYTPNIQPMQDQIEASKRTQNGLATGLTPKLQALDAPYQQTTHQAGVDYQNESRAASDKFLNDIGQSSDKLGQNLSDALIKRTMYTQPQIQSQMKEQMAASGGLQRGAYDQAVMQNGQNLSNTLATGQQGIVDQQLQARQDAMKSAYSVDQNLINERLGIDQDTLSKIYSSGRTDLIDEANRLLGIEQNANTQHLGVLGYKEAADQNKFYVDKNDTNNMIRGVVNSVDTVGNSFSRGDVLGSEGSDKQDLLKTLLASYGKSASVAG